MNAEEFLKEAAVMKYVRHPNLMCVCGGGGDVWVGHRLIAHASDKINEIHRAGPKCMPVFS